MLSLCKRLLLVTHEPRTNQAELFFADVCSYSPSIFFLGVRSQSPRAGACLFYANPSAANVPAGIMPRARVCNAQHHFCTEFCSVRKPRNNLSQEASTAKQKAKTCASERFSTTHKVLFLESPLKKIIDTTWHQKTQGHGLSVAAAHGSDSLAWSPRGDGSAAAGLLRVGRPGKGTSSSSQFLAASSYSAASGDTSPILASAASNMDSSFNQKTCVRPKKQA